MSLPFKEGFLEEIFQEAVPTSPTHHPTPTTKGYRSLFSFSDTKAQITLRLRSGKVK